MDHLPYSIKYSRSASVSLSRDAEETQDPPANHDDQSVAVAPVHNSVDATEVSHDAIPITA